MTRDEFEALAKKAGLAKYGLGWTAWESQLERFAELVASHEREAVRLNAQAAPEISTEHGPWVESPTHEGETYCKRCLVRSVFAGHKKCEPHIVSAPAAPQPAQQPLTDDDKRLLEMAAKAAGWLVYEDACGNRGSWWRPLDDDGDALRLACALEIDVSFRVVGGSRVEALAPGGPRIIERYTQASERASATRLAIVRAAAAIGEKMP